MADKICEDLRKMSLAPMTTKIYAIRSHATDLVWFGYTSGIDPKWNLMKLVNDYNFAINNNIKANNKHRAIQVISVDPSQAYVEVVTEILKEPKGSKEKKHLSILQDLITKAGSSCVNQARREMISCPHCSKRVTKNGLKKHIKIVHVEGNKRDYSHLTDRNSIKVYYDDEYYDEDYNENYDENF